MVTFICFHVDKCFLRSCYFITISLTFAKYEKLINSLLYNALCCVKYRNFTQFHGVRHSLWKGTVSGDSTETMRKLCLSTKFPHHEIMWNYGILRSAPHSVIEDADDQRNIHDDVKLSNLRKCFKRRCFENFKNFSWNYPWSSLNYRLASF